MATYRYPQYLIQRNHPSFDDVNPAGSDTPFSGIYTCEGCGAEVVSMHGQPLPKENHHRHTAEQGSVRWRLIVAHR